MVQTDTLVIDLGEVWMEYHNVPRTNVNSLAAKTLNIDLKRPGRFAGGVGCPHYSTGFASGVEIISNASGDIEYGDVATQVRVSCVNLSGAPISLGMHVIVFLKK